MLQDHLAKKEVRMIAVCNCGVVGENAGTSPCKNYTSVTWLH